MDAVKLRDATEADLPAIVEIYNSTVPGRMVTADTEPVSVEKRLPWFRGHDPRRRPLWVMEDDGSVTGWLSLSDFHDGRPAYHATAEIGIYVPAGAPPEGDRAQAPRGGHTLRSGSELEDPDWGRLRPQHAEHKALRGLRLRALGALSEGGGARRRRAGSRRPRPETIQNSKGEER